ncbi:DMT family transporter [Ammoniphilus sp. YIM 78166]|uniref:DMT family transporter n=1 Tax=Ammoniphilus sp. YIM 78166 TaxID=1644106 RepID=UPI00142FEDB1|nr:DMT family transporter [Ammoniphilus sp. YIM 78166]
MFQSQRGAYLFATFVTISMGHNMILIKSLLFTVEPLVLTYIRMTITALTLVLLSYTACGFIWPHRNQWKHLFLTSFFGVFLHQITLALGLQLSQATNGALIMGLNPLTTTLFAALLLKEPLNRNHYVGVVLGFIGIFSIVFKGFSSLAFSAGDILLFISMATQAFSFIYFRKLADTMHVVHVNMYTYVLGALMLLVVPIGQDMSSLFTFGGLTWGKIFLSSAVLTTLGFIGWNICLQRLGAGGASIFLNVITITAVFGSVVYLGETLLIQHIVGFMLISAGIWISTKQRTVKAEKTALNQKTTIS